MAIGMFEHKHCIDLAGMKHFLSVPLNFTLFCSAFALAFAAHFGCVLVFRHRCVVVYFVFVRAKNQRCAQFHNKFEFVCVDVLLARPMLMTHC